MMKASFIINKESYEQSDIVMEIPFNSDIKYLTSAFTDFLVKVGYKLPGFIDLIYYDDLK